MVLMGISSYRKYFGILLLIFGQVYLTMHECTGQGVSQYGPYKTKRRRLYLPNVLDRKSNPRAIITYPENISKSKEKLPLLVFAHGFAVGGWLTYPAYKGLLNGLASFGFIVVAPMSCQTGCPGWGKWETYDDEVLKILAYVDRKITTNGSIFQSVNRTAGYGVLGHSTGGRAVAEVLAVANSTNNVKAGVLLHAYPGNLSISVPTAVYTGTADDVCCGEEAAKSYYQGVTSSSKAYANMVGATHSEPNFKTKWTSYTAAWFQVQLNGDKSFYYSLIYNRTNPDSLCGGTIPMNSDCEVLE